MRLPQINPKAIYELLNKLTNRKPVKVNEDADLFADLSDDVRQSKSRNYVIKRPTETNRVDKNTKKSISQVNSSLIRNL